MLDTGELQDFYKETVDFIYNYAYVMVVMRIRSLRDPQCPNSEPTGNFFLNFFLEAIGPCVFVEERAFRNRHFQNCGIAKSGFTPNFAHCSGEFDDTGKVKELLYPALER